MSPLVKKRLFFSLQFILALAVTLIMMFPIYWMFITSVKSQQEVLQAVPTLWPSQFHFENFSVVMKAAPFGLYTKNTIIMTVGIMVLQLVIGIFAAYGFAKGSFWGRDKMFLLVLGAMMVPHQAIFIPLYLIVAKLKWIDTFAGLIIPNAVSAYAIFLLRQTFKSINDNYLEAGRIDGIGRIGLIFKILVPMCKPTVITLTIITFINGWNQYFWPLIVTNKETVRPITLGLAKLKRAYAGLEVQNFNEIMAGSVLAILPIVILFIALQKYVVKGVANASLK
ncbi:MAG: carbohydrate ABC transporter permease [Bacillota bacterium]|nr:carbohydrate ABC transporter permease [Bacillota bacterium]